MVRNYRKKTARSTISEESMKNAILDVMRKLETPTSASLKYNIKRSTLNSRIKKKVASIDPLSLDTNSDSGHDLSDGGFQFRFSSKYAVNQIFTKIQEEDIANYLKKCSKLQYGLSYKAALSFAYQFARLNDIPRPQSWDINKTAGRDWLFGYLKRNPSLSLRKPEKTSVARLRGFNRTAVNDFFENLKSCLNKFSFCVNDIYNLDETGLSTVMDPPKIIAEKGQRSVSQAVSGERGSLVTLVGIVNAAGCHIPPAYIYPRIRSNERFSIGGVVGSVTFNSKSGWINAEIFVNILKHIQNHTRCTVDKPILLLMDNHVSHCSIESILYGRENGIIMLSFPPHTSHKLQPLDVSVFGPFKKYCKTSFNDFLTTNPGKTINIYDVAQLTRLPFLKAFSPENIINGFLATGISPFNSMIFADDAYVAEDEIELDENLSENTNHNIIVCSDNDKRIVMSPDEVRPIPRIKKKNLTKREGKSRIFTSTPEKNRIEAILKARNDKMVRITKKSKAMVKKEKARKIIEFSSSEDGSDAISFAESIDSVYAFSEEGSSNQDIPEMLLIDTDILGTGTYVLVKFLVKSSLIFYVGKIVDVEENEIYIVSFLRKHPTSQSFIEPAKEDISSVLRNDILMKLPMPEHPPGTSRSAKKYNFSTDLSKYNIR